jgi:hypothetical protein
MRTTFVQNDRIWGMGTHFRGQKGRGPRDDYPLFSIFYDRKLKSALLDPSHFPSVAFKTYNARFISAIYTGSRRALCFSINS